jgi:hypothetical protein
MEENNIEITSEYDQQIYQSIENSKYIWRTAESISKEIEVPMVQIKVEIEVLRLSGVIIISSKTNRAGLCLYTTKEKYYSRKNIFSRVMSVLADQVK